jgi:hypothetical protein
MPRYCDRSACTPCLASPGDPCDDTEDIIIERAEIDEEGYLDLLLERKNEDGTHTHWEGSLSGTYLKDKLWDDLEEFTIDEKGEHHDAS